MENLKRDKIERILGIYMKLLNGHVIDKSAESVSYGVNECSVQRDTDDIRNYLEKDGGKVRYINSVVYGRGEKGYYLEQVYKIRPTNSEVLTSSKILLDN